MVKRFFSLMILASSMLAAHAQYQITNGDFETWGYDGDNLPNNWNSFQTADGSLSGSAYSSSNRQVKKSTDVRSGASGFSCAIWARSVFGVVAQGNLTTGRVHAASITAANINNYNYSDRDGSNTNNGVTNPCAMKFSGHPDAISVWVKFVPAGTVASYPNAKFSAIVHDDHDYISYGLSSNDNDTNKGYIVASVAKEFPSCDWTNYVLDFTYNSSNDNSKYIQFNASTNAYPGKGTSGDYLYIDDITLIYNSELTSATYDDATVSFTNGAATVDAVYDESKLALTSNGHAATIEKSYNAVTGVLTITVKGENFSEDATNYHTYTIQFKVSATAYISAAAKYATFCAPFDVVVPNRYVLAYKVTANENGTLKLESVGNKITAGTAVVLFDNSTSTTDVSKEYTDVSTATEATCTTDLLTGLLTAGSAPVGSYVLQNHDGHVAFYLVEGSEFSLSANRCYLTLPTSSAKVIDFAIEDETDGINAVEANGEKENVIYDLSGRRVKNATKGVYIINGKKVVLK